MTNKDAKTQERVDGAAGHSVESASSLREYRRRSRGHGVGFLEPEFREDFSYRRG
jgi:hypothetical protein